MRLVVLSMALPLVLAVAGCAAPDGESPAWEPADEAQAQAQAAPAGQAAEIKAKGTEIVSTIIGLVKLNLKWSKQLRGGATTAEARREIQEMEQKMRVTVATLPAEAEWVTAYVQHDADSIKDGLASALASEQARTHLGAEKIRKLTEAVDHAGGVDAIILKAAATVHDHAREVGDALGHGHQMPRRFVCSLVGTIAGANAARGDWPGVAGPLSAMMEGHCLD